MTGPLVSVICLCYNHERFVQEAIESVLNQSYPNLQIIVVDDASLDKSVSVIHQVVGRYSTIEFLPLQTNHGNCTAFNKGLSMARGEYIIDFSTDDVMMPDRIQKQIDLFNVLDSRYGVVFTDAAYIDAEGKILRYHYDHLFQKKLLSSVPQGDIYCKVLSTYFIASPTMMVRRKVLESLGGYDEALAYEDFDFWVRSSRNFYYAFLDEKLTRIRQTKNSMSAGWYQPGDPQLHSTYLVCRKIKLLNRTEAEHQSLVRRLRYELRQAVFSKNVKEAILFYDFLAELSERTIMDRVLYGIKDLPIPFKAIRNLMQ